MYGYSQFRVLAAGLLFHSVFSTVVVCALSSLAAIFLYSRVRLHLRFVKTSVRDVKRKCLSKATSCFSCDWERQTLTLTHGAECYRVNVLKAWQEGRGRPKPALVLVHGTGGSSLTWACALDALTERYDVFALDLPGNGVSQIPVSVRLDCPDVFMAFFDGYFKAVLAALQLEAPCVLAHSFGAFLVAGFACRHPGAIGRLGLVNAAGLFANHNVHDAYWSLLFTVVIPFRILRTFAYLFGVRAVIHALDAIFKASHHDTFLDALRAVASRADVATAAFIQRSWLHVSWRRPLLPALLKQQRTPWFVLHGADDPLMPPAIGRAILRLTDSNTPCYVVARGGHSPWRNPAATAAFSAAVAHGFDNAAVAGPRALAAGVTAAELLHQRYRSSYSPAWNARMLGAQYEYFKQRVGASVAGPEYRASVDDKGRVHIALQMEAC